MSSELWSLKQELKQKGSHSRLQDEELMSAMREQVTNYQNDLRAPVSWFVSPFHSKTVEIQYYNIVCVFCPGVASHPEGAGVGAAFGECVSRKRRAEGEPGLLTDASGSARPTQPAAQPAGTYTN